jgi:hypothetical protein
VLFGQKAKTIYIFLSLILILEELYWCLLSTKRNQTVIIMVVALVIAVVPSNDRNIPTVTVTYINYSFVKGCECSVGTLICLLSSLTVMALRRNKDQGFYLWSFSYRISPQ